MIAFGYLTNGDEGFAASLVFLLAETLLVARSL